MSKSMKRIAASAVAVSGILAAAAAAQQPGRSVTPVKDPVIARGEYLVHIASCNDCHTPFKMGPNGPEPDMSRMLSGHPADVPLEPLPRVDPGATWNWSGHAVGTAFAGPWGISVARNLTPDAQGGLGAWTEAQFVRAMREGKHLGVPDGRPILPPMVWPSVAQMTDEDLHAVWTYLRAIPAVRNDAPQSIPAPPPPAKK